MNYKRSRSGSATVREPVQVYLDPADRARLERLTEQLGTSKSDALRKGLEALERQLTDPSAHPALRIIGIASGQAPADIGDPARDHDDALARDEAASWGASGGPEPSGSDTPDA